MQYHLEIRLGGDVDQSRSMARFLSCLRKAKRRETAVCIRHLLFVEVIMRRLFVSATVFLVFVLAVVGDQPESNIKEFAKDIEQLNGSWMSPKTEFAPGITGHFQMKLEFKKD